MELRLLSALEVLEARREAAQLAESQGERALCSNACLLARALERVRPEGEPLRRRNSGGVGKRKKKLAGSPGDRLRWRVLKQFGALPTERRARQMKERDYLWCLLNQLLDDQEELDQLCPTCRAEAEQERCPGCGALIQASGVNPSFDMERFRRLKEGEGT